MKSTTPNSIKARNRNKKDRIARRNRLIQAEEYIERLNSSEIELSDLSKYISMYISVCSYPKCGKYYLLNRSNRRFCKDSCRVMDCRSSTPNSQ